MAIFLLKKSYQASDQKEIGFKDLWGSHGVFTTIRLLGKPGKLVFFKSHLKGLIKSLKKYKICLLYTSPSPRDGLLSRMPSSA